MTSPAAPLLNHAMQPLRPWLDDSSTEDIAINEPGRAWIQHHGFWESVDVPLDYDDLRDIATLSASLGKQEVGEQSPLCTSELPGGERIQICMPPKVPAGTISLAIRVHEQGISPVADVQNRYELQGWTKQSPHKRGRDLTAALSAYDAEDFAGFLDAAVDARLNILCCGSTGAGKTTLSKTIISAIPRSRRIITIEHAVELQLFQENVVRLIYRKHDLTGDNIDADVLVEVAMSMIPDILLIQELRGAEACSYLLSACSGHPGSCTSIHGRTPAEALQRLALLVKSSDAGRAIDREDLAALISNSVDVVIPLLKDGSVKPRIHDVWFVADAARRGETAGDLLRA